MRDAATRFAVSPSAAIKLMKRFTQTGSVAPAQIGGHRRPILEPHEWLLRSLVEGNREITLAEIQAELVARVDQRVSLSTIHMMLIRLGLRRKNNPGAARPL